MTIYIDKAEWVTKAKNPRKQYAHMISDTSLEELHFFAAQMGIKRHFFHQSRACKHYDISGEQIQKVLSAGAYEVSSKEIVKLGRYVV